MRGLVNLLCFVCCMCNGVLSYYNGHMYEAFSPYNQHYKKPNRDNIVKPKVKRHFKSPTWVGIYNKLSSERRQKQVQSANKHNLYSRYPSYYNHKLMRQRNRIVSKNERADKKNNVPGLSSIQQRQAYSNHGLLHGYDAARAQFAPRVPYQRNVIKKQAPRTPYMTNPYAMNPYYRNLYAKRIYVYTPPSSLKMQIAQRKKLLNRNILIKKPHLKPYKTNAALAKASIPVNSRELALAALNARQLQNRKNAALLLKLKNNALQLVSKKQKVIVALPSLNYLKTATIIPFPHSIIGKNVFKLIPVASNAAFQSARNQRPNLATPNQRSIQLNNYRKPNRLIYNQRSVQPVAKQTQKSLLLNYYPLKPETSKQHNKTAVELQSHQPQFKFDNIQPGHLLQSLYDYEQTFLHKKKVKTSKPYQRTIPRKSYAKKDPMIKKLNIVDEADTPTTFKNTSGDSDKYSKRGNSKKTYVPHVSNGWRKHHIFHQTTEQEEPADHWEYRKFHVYHKITPVHWIDNKREHLMLPYAKDSSDGLDEFNNYDFPDDVDDDESDTPAFTATDDDDDDDDDDLPSIRPGHQKTPLLNIETPSMNLVPKSVKNQLEHAKPEEYDIEKGDVTSEKNHEPIVSNFISKEKVKDSDSVRKSSLTDENLLGDFMHADPTGDSHEKKELSEEEMEAMKEDQDASSLIKEQQEKGKLDDQPEVVGFGKNGMNAADKAAITARLSNSDIQDPSVVGREGVDTANLDVPKEFKTHMGKDVMDAVNYELKKSPQHAVDKQKISEADMDYHHIINEEDTFNKHAKKSSNDYAPYDDDEQEETHNDRSNEDSIVHGHAIDTRDGNNVEDTIRKLEDNDKIESEKLVKKFTSNSQHPAPDRGDYDEDSYPSEHSREYRQNEDASETKHYFRNSEERPGEHGTTARNSVDDTDILDPVKAGERGIHLSEEAEISKRLNRDNAAELEKLFLKNARSSDKQHLDGNSYLEKTNSFTSDVSPANTLTPEDALHALDGRKTVSGILSKSNEVAEGENGGEQGPPEAVKNEIVSPKSTNNSGNQAVWNNKGNAESSEVSKVKEDVKKHVSNISINDMENATVAKEVVSILESLGQVKTSFDGVEKPILVADTNQTQLQQATDTKKQETSSSLNQDSQSITVERQQTDSSVNTKNSTAPVTLNATSTDLKSNSTSDNPEEKETKEAVHDLRVAIGILEKKLELITSAKKNGNNKPIYIVDQTRTSKPITKSKIYRGVKSSKQKNAINFMKKAISHVEEATYSGKHHERKRIRKRHHRRKEKNDEVYTDKNDHSSFKNSENKDTERHTRNNKRRRKRRREGRRQKRGRKRGRKHRKKHHSHRHMDLD